MHSINRIGYELFSPSKILFSNRNSYKNIRIENQSGTLSQSGIDNLRILLSAGKKDNFAGSLVSNSKSNTELAKQLESNGIAYKTEDGKDIFQCNPKIKIT